jgi:hypothetical protein
MILRVRMFLGEGDVRGGANERAGLANGDRHPAVDGLIHPLDQFRINHGIRPPKGVRGQRDVLANKIRPFPLARIVSGLSELA